MQTRCPVNIRNHRIHGLTLLVAAVMIVTAACAGNITPTRQIDDALLSANVRDALSSDPALRGYDIVVNAQGGVVTLIGTVRNDNDRQTAGRIAGRVEGVAQVVNELRVN